MGIFDSLIQVGENGEFVYNQWIEWEHVSTGLLHCPVCLALDKCWFNIVLKPQLPQHEKCHCIAKNIEKPIPNFDAKAKCDLKKFTEYIFSEKYAWNGKKGLFELLGFTINDSQNLKEEYEKQAVKQYCDGNYKLGKIDSQGQRINIDIIFEKNNRNITFTSGWMVRPKGKITNNTPLAD